MRPTDEEILKAAMEHDEEYGPEFGQSNGRAFTAGARWAIDQLPKADQPKAPPSVGGDELLECLKKAREAFSRVPMNSDANLEEGEAYLDEALALLAASSVAERGDGE